MEPFLIARCPSAWQALFPAPDPLLKVAQERNLSNVVVVENNLALCWSFFFFFFFLFPPAVLIFKPPDPDPNTSVSETLVPRDSARKWAEKGSENHFYAALWSSFTGHRWTIGLFDCTYRRVRVCVVGLLWSGRVRVSVVCFGRWMLQSIARSEGNVSLSAESIHSHQEGSLSIMVDLKESTLPFSFVSLYPLWPLNVWGDHCCWRKDSGNTS